MPRFELFPALECFQRLLDGYSTRPRSLEVCRRSVLRLQTGKSKLVNKSSANVEKDARGRCGSGVRCARTPGESEAETGACWDDDGRLGCPLLTHLAGFIDQDRDDGP